MGDLEKYRFKNSYLYRKKLRKNLDEDDMRDDKVFLVGYGEEIRNYSGSFWYPGVMGDFGEIGLGEFWLGEWLVIG